VRLKQQTNESELKMKVWAKHFACAAGIVGMDRNIGGSVA